MFGLNSGAIIESISHYWKFLEFFITVYLATLITPVFCWSKFCGKSAGFELRSFGGICHYSRSLKEYHFLPNVEHPVFFQDLLKKIHVGNFLKTSRRTSCIILDRIHGNALNHFLNIRAREDAHSLILSLGEQSLLSTGESYIVFYKIHRGRSRYLFLILKVKEGTLSSLQIL